jgi:hypothetical protein
MRVNRVYKEIVRKQSCKERHEEEERLVDLVIEGLILERLLKTRR